MWFIFYAFPLAVCGDECASYEDCRPLLRSIIFEAVSLLLGLSSKFREITINRRNN